ncbi:MAG: acyl transferase, partial [Cyclobacteriaceae bacterium]
FKTQRVASGEWKPEAEFSSSGTTGATTSRHLVWSLPFYFSHAEFPFERFFGPLKDCAILALLPSYL